MRVDLKCFATLANPETCDFKKSTAYELEDGQTLKQLIVRAGINPEDVAMAFVNGRVVNQETVLYDGDRIGLTPASAALKSSLAF